MLKSLLVLSAFLTYATPALAEDPLTLLECSVSIEMPDQTKTEMNFRITTVNNTLKAWVDTLMPGAVLTMPSEFKMSTEDVREGLTPLVDPTDLNYTEKLIVHAMAIEATPELSTFLNSGVDLKAVRTARIFIFGEPTDMGSTTVIQAFDANGKDLGSFLGGFLVAPCGQN